MKIANDLLNAITYAKENTPFYQKQLHNIHIHSDFTQTDFNKIPFTTKDDVSNYNKDFLAVSLTEVIEYATTSGTSGKPVTVYLTENDLKNLAYNEAQSLKQLEVNANDVIQLMTTMDRQFMAGLAYFLGTREIGAGIIRIGPGVPQLQWQSIFENDVTTLITVPSFILSLLSYAKENNIDWTLSKVTKIMCIGEPIRTNDFHLNTLGKQIQSQWDVDLFSTYASTEMRAAFTECTQQKGGHLIDKLLHLEVIDEHGNQVETNEIGEVVITNLNNQGMPLIRYKTGDLAKYLTEKCPCGRNTPRLGPIIGRKNQMIKFKGTTLFPNTIFDVFDQDKRIPLYKIEVAKDYLGQDTLTVLLPKSIENKLNLEELAQNCRAKIKVVPHIIFLEDEYLRDQIFKKHMRKPEKISFK